MKVLFDCPLPFSLAHGGQAIQIHQTMAALQAIGVAVEPLRWWDENQIGDLIHYCGRMPADHIRFAHQKGIKVIMAELLTEAGSQTHSQQLARRIFRFGAERFAPRGLAAQFRWEAYRLADGFAVLTAWEKQLIEYKFGAAPAKAFVIPNGVEKVFFDSPKTNRDKWLVCTATITARKRVLELAQAAVAARTPLWVVGKAYSDSDAYSQRFLKFAAQNSDFIRYEGPVNNRAALALIYRAARGFVLLSAMESLSLSALEAAACECPLLLSDLPWARSTFALGTAFCPVTNSTVRTATALKSFYAAAPDMVCPPKPATWTEVAMQFQSAYERILSRR